MDDCRFDNWTRKLGGATDRRTAVKEFAAGAAAVATLLRAELGLAQTPDVTAEVQCAGKKARCRRNKDCCSLRCKKKKRRKVGRCKCAGKNARCLRDRGCCSGVCRQGRCDCGNQGDFCHGDADCCSRRCVDGNCRCARRGDRCDTGRACCSGSCGSDRFCN